MPPTFHPIATPPPSNPPITTITTTTTLLFFLLTTLLILILTLYRANPRRCPSSPPPQSERTKLRPYPDVTSQKRITVDEYEGLVDEWGLFPQKAAEAGDGDGDGDGELGEGLGGSEEVKTEYGTLGW